MTRAQRSARRWRWALLTLGSLFLVSGVVWLALPLLIGAEDTPGLMGVIGLHTNSEALYSVIVIAYIGAFFLTQWLFLRPRKYFAMRLTLSGRPMKRSIFSAALVAALLTVGLVASLLEIPDWWRHVVARDWPKGVAASDLDEDSFRVWPGLVAIGVAWAIWAGLFFRYWRAGERYTHLTRMIRGLLAGSIVELFVATSVHAFAYRRDECYCCRGSYTGLVFGGTAILWVFGPGIILLFLRERHRQRRLLPVCLECGYDLRGLDGSTCPECGRVMPDEVGERVRAEREKDA